MPFIPNPKAMAELAGELHKSGQMRRMADRAVEAAQAVAPVRTGAYRDSIKTVDGPDGVEIVSTDWKAIFIEYGTVKTSPKAPLRRGVVAAGYELREHPKK